MPEPMDHHANTPSFSSPSLAAPNSRLLNLAPAAHFSLLIALLMLGGIVRFHQLGAKGLWGDEIWTAQWSQGSLRQVWISLTAIPDMPLMYALVNISTRIGQGEFWVRLPSAAFGVAGLLMFYLLARLTLGRRTALVGIALIVLSPIHIWYSQDARYYTQLAALGIASVCFFYWFLTADKVRLLPWFGFLMASIAAIYTHLFAGWILFAQAVFAAYYLIGHALRSEGETPAQGRQARTKALWLAAAMLVLVVFTFPVMLRLIETLQSGTSLGGEGMARLRLLPVLPDFLTWAFLAEIVQNFSGGRVATLLMLPLFVIGLVSVWQNKRDVAVLVLCLIAAPFVTTLFLELLHGIAFKYFFYLLPVYLLLVAQGLVTVAVGIGRAAGSWQGRRRSGYNRDITVQPQVELAALLALLAIVAMLYARPLTLINRQAKINDWRAIAAYLMEVVQPEDVVLVERWGIHALRYYLPANNHLALLEINQELWARAPSLGARVWVIGLDDVYEPLAEATLQRIEDAQWQDARWIYTRSPESVISYPVNEPAAKIFLGEGSAGASMYDFGDVADADWTQDTYREVLPGQQAVIRLTLEATSPRVLSLRYFNHPGKDFEVWVDGRVIDAVTGGAQQDWQIWQSPLPETAGDSVRVAITATGTEIVGIDWAELTYAAQPE